MQVCTCHSDPTLACGLSDARTHTHTHTPRQGRKMIVAPSAVSPFPALSSSNEWLWSSVWELCLFCGSSVCPPTTPHTHAVCSGDPARRCWARWACWPLGLQLWPGHCVCLTTQQYSAHSQTEGGISPVSMVPWPCHTSTHTLTHTLCILEIHTHTHTHTH